MKKWWFALIIELFMIMAFAIIYFRFDVLPAIIWNDNPTNQNTSTEETVADSSEEQDATEQPFIETIYLTTEEAPITTITISGAGDCTFGRDVEQGYALSYDSYYDKHGAGYFFENVKHIFQADDLSIVNFEGTLTKRGARQDKTWAFKGKTEYLNTLIEGGIEAVGFDNNHSKDYGTVSYTDTMDAFDEYGIYYASRDIVSVYEAKDIRIGMVAINALTGGSNAENRLLSAMEKIRESSCDMIVVSFHWGEEGSPNVTDKQKSLGKMAIDEGANLVLGHHPHILQGIEEYNGAYIVYSLGNFAFGGSKNPSDFDTMIFQQTFSFQDGELLDTMNAQIIPCSISSVSNINNFQPTVLENDAKQRVIDKINKRSQNFNIIVNDDGKISAINQ